MKKFFKAIGIIVISLAVIFILFVIFIKVQIDRGNIIKWGNEWYTKSELEKILPPQEYVVESKNSPEEVYEIFRQALLANDIEKALGQIREEKREIYREAFKDKKKLDEWVKKLPNELKLVRIENNYAYFDVDYGTDNLNTAHFIKNQEGYWQIDQI